MLQARTHALLAAPALAIAPLAGAQTVTYAKIPGALSADDMSPDGRFVVGLTDLDGDGFPDGIYRLDLQLDEMTMLPPPGTAANAVSDDGQVILGNMPDQDGNQVAAIWTEQTGWFSLGSLPNALPCPGLSTGYELSADGSVAVGLSWDGCSGRGFIWRQDTGMLELQNLGNGNNRASVVSADGTVAGGFAQGSFSRTPSFWTGDTAGQLLDPPNGDAVGEVHGLRDDGSILLGTWAPSDSQPKAVMWTYPELERTPLGAGSLFPSWEGIPMDIADDGTVVGFDFFVGNRRAWIIPAGERDIRQLRLFVTDHGGEVPVDVVLEVCQAISADGRLIVGHSFGTGAWRVDIDGGTPCPWDCGNGDGVTDTVDFLALLAEWGQVGTPCDLDGNGVDTVDFLALLANWGACP